MLPNTRGAAAMQQVADWLAKLGLSRNTLSALLKTISVSLSCPT